MSIDFIFYILPFCLLFCTFHRGREEDFDRGFLFLSSCYDEVCC
ncbi:hypothetical protein NC652_003540 [Populus alba x Populus x berolinensis]|uniref:Uncharacterized protein n=1 Tax=Populus alba x Populus x berolinensis TaxID=444605 RepID=A0AAD6WJB2_9ROSI|nr:hypothetical protein NC652_003540 [Populus alba x Populus x berolinensis]KAJ7014016.1 hypothetical protein NC653_003596 [Populus alba x Populus x berolinensis]